MSSKQGTRSALRKIRMQFNVPQGSQLDPGIIPAVKFLNEHGFETFESCQGGEGHLFPDPTVRFYGDESDALRAYDACEKAGFCVHQVRRVWRKADEHENEKGPNHSQCWGQPFNEIVFLHHAQTGTIYRPH